MKRMIDAILERLQAKKNVVAAVFAMGIKGVGALLTIAIFTLAARAASAEEFGRLAIWFNALLLLAIVACFGQDTLIGRSWGEYCGRDDRAMALGAYRYGWRMLLGSAILFVAGLLVLGPRFDPSLSSTSLSALAAFMFAQTLLHYSSHSSRVIVGIAVSEIGRDILWRIVLLIAVAVAVLLHGLSVAEFYFAGAAGMILCVVIQSIAVRRALRAAPAVTPRETDRADWSRRGFDMWLSAAVEAASAYADVMLVGYFAGPAAAGEYFVAARIANIFLMVQSGLASYGVSRSAHLFFSGQIDRLQDILRSSVAVCVALSAPVLLIILVFGEHILALFGERYVVAYPTLVMLAGGAFAMALNGASSLILLTTGQEKLYSRTVLVATAARMILTAALGAGFGAFGAACGWALVNAPLAVWLARICRRSSGVDPSILSVLAPYAGRLRAWLGAAPVAHS